MGYSKTINRLFFDIETRAHPDAESLVGVVKAPRNIKDEDKIEQAIEKKTQELIEKAPLDPDLGVIKSISLSIQSTGVPTILLVPDNLPKSAKGRGKLTTDLYDEVMSKIDPTTEWALENPDGFDLHILNESEMIEMFWDNLNLCNGCNVTYNGLAFDFPFLMHRSMDLKIEPGILPNLAKYRTDPSLDLYGVLSGWNWQGGKRLKWIADRYGLEIIAEDEDGASSLDATDSEMVLYSLSDLWITAQLYRRMNHVFFNHLGEE